MRPRRRTRGGARTRTVVECRAKDASKAFSLLAGETETHLLGAMQHLALGGGGGGGGAGGARAPRAVRDRAPPGSALLARAAKRDDLKAMSAALAKAGTDVNYVNRKGYTALHYAAFRGNVAATCLLLQHNADVHLRNIDGETAADAARASAPAGMESGEEALVGDDTRTRHRR